MKFELELPDWLASELQRKAAATQGTLPQVITQAITSWLQQTPPSPPATAADFLPVEKHVLLHELLFDGGPCLVTAEEMKRLTYE